MFFPKEKVEEEDVDVSDEEEVEEKDELTEFLKNLDLDGSLAINATLPQYEANDILGDQTQIYQMLSSSVKYRNELIDNVENRFDNICKAIEYFKSFLLDDEPRRSRIKENKFILSDKYFLDEIQVEEKMKRRDDFVRHGSEHEDLEHKVNPKKTFENAIYVGFDDNELTEFPGFIEALQLLKNLSNKMKFKAGFIKYWTPIIRSEASCAILLDSFWWFYLSYFKKDSRFESDAYKHFCRIADSFTALLLSIDSSIRDKFFDNYANFLSQAIYLAFYLTFDDSRHELNDEFKQELCNVVNEWILGVRPIPESYKHWEINDEINLNSLIELKAASNAQILTKISNLEKMINNLGERDKLSVGVKFIEDDGKAPGEKERKALSLNLNKESHVSGEGAKIDKFLFNLKGQSVLVNQYLRMHNLKPEKEYHDQKITRTEIVKQPSQNAQTYRDIIRESMQRAKSMEEELNKIRKENQVELNNLELERRKTVEEIKLLKRFKPAKPREATSTPQTRNSSPKSYSNLSIASGFDSNLDRD